MIADLAGMEVNSLPPVEADEVREAVLRLLEERGLTCSHDELVIKQITSRTGRRFYVLMALNGCEKAVAEAIAPHTCRSASPGVFGVWVLRQSDLRPILEKAAALAR